MCILPEFEAPPATARITGFPQDFRRRLSSPPLLMGLAKNTKTVPGRILDVYQIIKLL